MTLNREPFVAGQDITCYKVLEKIAGGYRTPYRNIPITIPGRIYADSREIPSGCDYYFGIKRWVVEAEGVHAYAQREKAKRGATEVKHWFHHDSLVVQCRIPEGTEYWRGMHGDIAARKMLIEKIVD